MKTPNKILLYILITILSLIIILEIWAIIKFPLNSKGYEGNTYQISEESIEFLYDLTYPNNQGIRTHEQEIFDKAFTIIDDAEKFIILDLFLFGPGDFWSKKNKNKAYRNLSGELYDKLVQKKQNYPNININLITDDYNIIHGKNKGEHLIELEKKGIKITYTPLPHTKLEQTLYFISTIINLPFSDSLKKPLLFKIHQTYTRGILKLLIFNLNHRKTIIADNKNEIVSFVTSANPHDLSSAHSNTAFYIKEKIWQDIYEAEKQISKISEPYLENILQNQNSLNQVYKTNSQDLSVQFLTEGKMLNSIIKEIDNTVQGESIEIMMLFLSNKEVINSLTKASQRGVNIKLILDPNKDAFGRNLYGIPNRPIAEEILKNSNDKPNKIKIRWYNTQGEQFHTKLVIIRKNNKKTIIFSGSSNLSNKGGLFNNLESDLKITTQSNSNLTQEIYTYFNRIWTNQNGTYTLDYKEYQDKSLIKKYSYKIKDFFNRRYF